MLIGIEGPDRAGKTSLLLPLAHALNAKPITRLPTCKASVKAWPYVEPIYLHLLEQMMNPYTDYVTDRSMTVSAQVYSAVFDRPLLFDPTPWFEREVIVYVKTPIDVLRSRWADEANAGDVFPVEMYERVIEEYARVLANYKTIVIDGTASTEHNVKVLCRKLRA